MQLLYVITRHTTFTHEQCLEMTPLELSAIFREVLQELTTRDIPANADHAAEVVAAALHRMKG